jgi:hypothetical protein
VNNGIAASSNTGDEYIKLSRLGIVTVSRATLTLSVPSIDAIDSHTNNSPSAAHTPHAEKLQMKK